jgi:hypothetical protein
MFNSTQIYDDPSVVYIPIVTQNAFEKRQLKRDRWESELSDYLVQQRRWRSSIPFLIKSAESCRKCLEVASYFIFLFFSFCIIELSLQVIERHTKNYKRFVPTIHFFFFFCPLVVFDLYIFCLPFFLNYVSTCFWWWEEPTARYKRSKHAIEF